MALIPTDGVLINTAPIVDSLTSDTYLIGYRGSGEAAYLVAVPVALFSGSASLSETTPLSASSASIDASADAPVAVSLEELFDEAHNQYKDCWMQLEVSEEGTVEVAKKVNLPETQIESSVEKVGRSSYIKVATGFKASDFDLSTAQVSQISLSSTPASATICVEEGSISLLFKNIPGFVNFMVKAPLTTATGIEFSQQ